MSKVIIESPYAGDVKRNLAYARACMADCLSRGEAPYASHLLYTQPGVLDDDNPDQRKLGIEAGYAFWQDSTIAFYIDLGWSTGMLAAASRLEGIYKNNLSAFNKERVVFAIRSLTHWEWNGDD